MPTTLTQTEIQSRLDAHNNGTDGLYRYYCETAISDGIKDLIELCECNWLTEAIASYQTQCQSDPMLKSHQFWELVVNEDESARLTCYRDENDPAFHQDFDCTTFPLDSIRIWVLNEGGQPVILLPTEW